MTSKEEQNEIKLLKEEEIKEEKFWKGYSNKLKEQIRSENIFEEVQNFKTLKNKENKNFFKKILKTLGF
jgi:hypothetical protein